jgi:hypothetical protein
VAPVAVSVRSIYFSQLPDFVNTIGHEQELFVGS